MQRKHSGKVDLCKGVKLKTRVCVVWTWVWHHSVADVTSDVACQLRSSNLLLGHPYPYRGGGRGGQNQPVEFRFLLLGNLGIVIQPLEWNCKVTFLNKPWAMLRKYLRLAPEYDHGSAIFWRDAIPTHVLLQSDMCLAPPELSANI